MLNPEFKMLDPDPVFVQRLRDLMPVDNGLEAMGAVSNELLQKHSEAIKTRIAAGGIITQHVLWPLLQELEPGLAGKVLTLCGLPLGLLAPVWEGAGEQASVLLGILTGEEIWTGIVIGLKQGSIDFLTTLQWLWQEEPALAGKQTLQDFEEWRQAAAKRFGRKTGGLFIYLDEFKQWQQTGFTRSGLEAFAGRQTAAMGEI